MKFAAPFFRPNIERLAKKKDVHGLVCAYLYGEPESSMALDALGKLNIPETALIIAEVLKESSIYDDSKKKFFDILLKLSPEYTIEGLLAYCQSNDLIEHSCQPMAVEIKDKLIALYPFAKDDQLHRYPTYLLNKLGRDDNENLKKSSINKILADISPTSFRTYKNEINKLLELGWQPETPYQQALILTKQGEYENAAKLGMEAAFYPLVSYLIDIEREYQELLKLKHLGPIDLECTNQYQQSYQRLYHLILDMGQPCIPRLLDLCNNLGGPDGLWNCLPEAIVSCALLVDLTKSFPQAQTEVIESLTKALDRGVQIQEIGKAIYQIAPGTNVRLFISKQLFWVVEQAGEKVILPLCEIDQDDTIPLSDYERKQIVQLLTKLLDQYPGYQTKVVQYCESRLAPSEEHEYASLRHFMSRVDWQPKFSTTQIFHHIFFRNWNECIANGSDSVFPLIKDLNLYCKRDRAYLTAKEINETLNSLYLLGKLPGKVKKSIEALDGQIIIEEYMPPAPTVFWDGWRDKPSEEELNNILLSEESRKYEPAYVFRLSK